jgi:hypothetical protein
MCRRGFNRRLRMCRRGFNRRLGVCKPGFNRRLDLRYKLKRLGFRN